MCNRASPEATPQPVPETIRVCVRKVARGRSKMALGVLGSGAQCTVNPKPLGEVLAGAKVRLGVYGDAVADGIEVEVWMKIGCLSRCCLRWLHSLYVKILLGWILCVTGVGFPCLIQ